MKRLNTNNLVLLMVFCAIFGSYPYIFGRLLPLPNLNLIYLVTSAVLTFVLILKRDNIRIPKLFSIICLTQIIAFCLLALFHSDLFYLNRYILFVIISYLFILALYNTIRIQRFIHYNNIVITSQVSLGLIAFVLVFFGVLEPLFTFSGGGDRIAFFYGITSTNAQVGKFIRVSGFFDEPGALAFWGIYSLVLNKLFIKNKLIEIFLIIGLFFTFSMAYYIQIILYFLFFYFNKNNILITISLLIILSIFYKSDYKLDTDSELYFLTIRRIERNSVGEIETNRDELTKNAYKLFASSPIIGVGETYAQSTGGVDDNPFETLAKGGILGTIALYLPLVIIIIHYRRVDVLKAAIILIIGYLQRPFHIHLIHFLMIYSFFLLSTYYYSKTHQNN